MNSNFFILTRNGNLFTFTSTLFYLNIIHFNFMYFNFIKFNLNFIYLNFYFIQLSFNFINFFLHLYSLKRKHYFIFKEKSLLSSLLKRYIYVLRHESVLKCCSIKSSVFVLNFHLRFWVLIFFIASLFVFHFIAVCIVLMVTLVAWNCVKEIKLNLALNLIERERRLFIAAVRKWEQELIHNMFLFPA